LTLAAMRFAGLVRLRPRLGRLGNRLVLTDICRARRKPCSQYFPQSPLLTSLMATHVTATHVLGLDFDDRLGEALDGPASERRRRRLRPARR
jgi:hypothetical protein